MFVFCSSLDYIVGGFLDSMRFTYRRWIDDVVDIFQASRRQLRNGVARLFIGWRVRHESVGGSVRRQVTSL